MRRPEVQFEVCVRHPAFGIARVPDESDMATCVYLGTLVDTLGHGQRPIGAAVVASGIVVVEMEVPALPAVGVINDHVATSSGALRDPVDDSVGDGVDGCELGRHQVDAHVDSAIRLHEPKGLEEPRIHRILREEEVQRWPPAGTESHGRDRQDGGGTSGRQHPEELSAAQRLSGRMHWAYLRIRARMQPTSRQERES